MLRMDQVAVVRHRVLVEGASRRDGEVGAQLFERAQPGNSGTAQLIKKAADVQERNGEPETLPPDVYGLLRWGKDAQEAVTSAWMASGASVTWRWTDA